MTNPSVAAKSDVTEAKVLIDLAINKAGNFSKLVALLAKDYEIHVKLPNLSMARYDKKLLSDSVIKALAEMVGVSALPALMERQRSMALRDGSISVRHLPPSVQESLITLSVMASLSHAA